MRKFSVVVQQMLVVFVVLILPAVLLFASYTNAITNLSTMERENSVRSSLQYINQTFGLLADTAHSEAVRISASEDYITAVTDFQDYDQVVRNVDLYADVQSIAHRLATVQFADEWLRNVYLYTLDTDYVITSDRGLLRFKNLKDIYWLESYKTYVESANNYRMPLWIGRTAPESDLLSNGSFDSQTPVISYILPVRIANSRSMSLLVMNYYETQIAKLINVDEENRVYIVDAQGKVICHPDLNMIGEDFFEKLNLSSALLQRGNEFNRDNQTGFSQFFANDQVLYSYLPIEIGNWVLVNENQLHAFTKQVGSATKAYFAVFTVLILAGTICYLHGVRNIIAPIARLSRKIELPNIRNEVLLIEEEIQRLQKREQELVSGVQRSYSNTQNLYLLTLLRDMPWSQTVPFQWPYNGFAVVVLSIDKASAVQFNSALLLLEAKERFSSSFYAQAITPDNRNCILILNTDNGDNIYNRIRQILAELRKQLAQHTEWSFTAGIGLYRENEGSISESYHQAGIAVRQRLLQGGGQEILYNENMLDLQFNCVSHKYGALIINTLESANLDALKNVLELLRCELKKLNVDSILQTVYQLINSIGAWLLEKRVVDDIWEGGMQAWYAEASTAETVDELLVQFFCHAQVIINYFGSEKNGQDYLTQIMNYIDEHYMEDIDFDEMSKQIGISYSYARRIMKQKTNRSLLETVHATRIQRAKKMLRDNPELSIKSIAANVGYCNIQSFNRFFKANEMMTPSEYRESNQNPEGEK